MVEFLDWQTGLMAMGLGCTAVWTLSMVRLVRLSGRSIGPSACKHRDNRQTAIDGADKAGPLDNATSCAAATQQAALPMMPDLAELQRRADDVYLRDHDFDTTDFTKQICDFTKDADFGSLAVLSQYRQSINALEEESARRAGLADNYSLVTLPEYWSLIPVPNKA